MLSSMLNPMQKPLQKIVPHLWFDKEAKQAATFYTSLFPASEITDLSPFNEAISLMVKCQDQAEIDAYWGQLSAVPEAEQCGWLKDKYGVSWQIVPANMDALLAKKPEKTTPAMLAMKKISIEGLRQAALS